jgi:hypothetical protein
VLGAALVLLSITLVDIVQGDSSRAARGVVRDAAFQAAEAGINDYTSKLLDDNQYYLHDVALGESTRRSSGGQLVAPGSSPTPWTYGITWTYPNGKDNWRQLTNGYEYNLQIKGLSGSQQYVDIVATGRKQGATAPARVLEERIRPSSVADFQMISNADVSYGSAASTYGKIYSGGDVNHAGTAYANIYAEGSVTGNPTMMNGALKYNSSNIRTVIKTPINFASFSSSLSDIARAAQIGGLYLDNAAVGVWRLTFNSGGTLTVQACSNPAGSATETTAPTCSLSDPANGTYTIPTNGAIYANQDVVVANGSSSCDGLSNASCVNGRATVASNHDIVIADDIGYVTLGDDVLGLIAKNEMAVAYWAPTTLTWRAATIAQSGQWRSAYAKTTTTGATFNLPAATIAVGSTNGFAVNTNMTVNGKTVRCSGKTATTFTGCTGGSGSVPTGSAVSQTINGTHGTMTFKGSTATALGGFMSMFNTRNYLYDDTLLYLQPPWFPTIDYAYTVLLFRELPSGYTVP